MDMFGLDFLDLLILSIRAAARIEVQLQHDTPPLLSSLSLYVKRCNSIF